MKLFATLSLGLFTYATVFAQLTYTESSSGLQNLQMESGIAMLRLVDVNNDGNLDLITVGDHGNGFALSSGEKGILLWKGNGTGNGGWTFSKSTRNFGYGGLALGDLNKDGSLDIAIGIHHPDTGKTGAFGQKILDAALGNNTGSFTATYNTGLVSAGETYGMFGVDLGDIDNDGDLDLGANCMSYYSGVQVYKNNLNGSWTHVDGTSSGNGTYDFYFADLDNDGYTDIAVGNSIGTTHFNNKANQFDTKVSGFPALNDVSGAVRGLSVGDINNDGAKDIAFTNGGTPTVLTWNKTQQKWASASSGLSGISDAAATWIADMNADGNMDLVLYESTKIEVYSGNGNGAWTLASTITGTQELFNGITTGDVDHDGYPDIVCLARTPGSYQFNTAYCNKMHLYKHTPDANLTLNIKPVYPHGNECYKNGSAQFIEWLSAVPTGTTSTVKIEFSSNGQAGPFTSVVASTKNNSRYQWYVPSNVNSNNCVLKFTVDNGTTPVVAYSNSFMVGACTSSLGVNENENTNTNIAIYPNPNSGEQATLTFALNTAQSVSIELYDVLGNMVYQKNVSALAGENKTEIDTHLLAKGLYTCKVAGEKQNQVTRIVIN